MNKNNAAKEPTEEGQYISAPDLRRWRTEVPNLVDDARLDPFAFRLLVHYYRRGDCYESTRTTAEVCCMSVGQVVETRRDLAAKGWIVINTEGLTHRIRVVDKWEENFATFSAAKASSVRGVNDTVHGVNDTVHGVNDTVHGVNQRINPLRRTVKNNGVTADEHLPEFETLFDETTPEGRARSGALNALTKFTTETVGVIDQVRLHLRLNPNWDTKTNAKVLRFLRSRPEGETVEKFAEWWFANDWRGKQGQAPTPDLIQTLWFSAFPLKKDNRKNTPQDPEVQAFIDWQKQQRKAGAL